MIPTIILVVFYNLLCHENNLNETSLVWIETLVSTTYSRDLNTYSRPCFVIPGKMFPYVFQCYTHIIMYVQYIEKIIESNKFMLQEDRTISIRCVYISLLKLGKVSIIVSIRMSR